MNSPFPANNGYDLTNLPGGGEPRRMIRRIPKSATSSILSKLYVRKCARRLREALLDAGRSILALYILIGNMYNFSNSNERTCERHFLSQLLHCRHFANSANPLAKRGVQRAVFDVGVRDRSTGALRFDIGRNT